MFYEPQLFFRFFLRRVKRPSKTGIISQTLPDDLPVLIQLRIAARPLHRKDVYKRQSVVTEADRLQGAGRFSGSSGCVREGAGSGRADETAASPDGASFSVSASVPL